MTKLKKLPQLEGIEELTIPDVIVEDIADLSHLDRRLKGIEFPTLVRNIDQFTRERWLSCIEIMLSRGIESATEIAALTGLSPKTAGQYKKMVITRWGDTMSQGTANSRRERLYFEADRVKAELWRKFEVGEQTGADFKEQISYLKMIVDTGARQAKLCGLETQQVEAELTIATNKTQAQMQADSPLAIPADKLEAIGKLIAQEVGRDES